MSKKIKERLNKFVLWWTAGKVGLLLLVFGLIGGVIGYQQQHPEGFSWAILISDFYANVSSEMASIAITVLIIDGLNRRHEAEERQEREASKEQHKQERYQEQLITELSSQINSEAKRAAERLRAQGWLEDGTLEALSIKNANLEDADLKWASLERVQFYRANLKNANLFGANLSNAHLAGTNFQGALMGKTILDGTFLEGADFTGARKLGIERLSKAARLKGAKMSDGNRYNGCFRLKSDLRRAKKSGHNLNDINAMAEWYGVPLELYLEGQEWADQYLSKIKRGVSSKWKNKEE